jgi:hypothetical protein
MRAVVLVCGTVWDGLSAGLAGPAAMLVEDKQRARIARSLRRPAGVRIIDVSDAEAAAYSRCLNECLEKAGWYAQAHVRVHCTCTLCTSP